MSRAQLAYAVWTSPAFLVIAATLGLLCAAGVVDFIHARQARRAHSPRRYK